MKLFLKRITCSALTLFLINNAIAADSPANPLREFSVAIQVHAGQPKGDLKPIWRMFGADEPNYATMKDGKYLLAEIGALRTNDMFFRAHNLLCTGDGTPALKWGSTGIYTEDADGKPIYNWTIIDHIFDTCLARGVRPYAQIGFMPEAMSVHPEPYQHEWRPGGGTGGIGTGWAYPPKDYAKWGELVYQWVEHCVARYGRAEVEHWYWEVWNEPNGAAYWHASPEEFYKLHDYAIDAVRRALPTARVGGPDVAGSGGKFMEDFLAHVTRGTNYVTGRIGTPTDFLAFHAKGSPSFVNHHVRLGIANQLRNIDSGFGMIKKVAELKDKPIVIGESDPDGCAACQGPQLGYRNTTMYSSYTAAVFARKHDLAARHGVNLDAALTWAFEFENQPFFSGQRTMANNGIDLPVFNVFRMFSKMGGERIEAESSGQVPLDSILRDGVRTAPDVGVLASVESKKLSVMIWYYHDDDLTGPDAAIELALDGMPLENGTAMLTHYRIDAEHSNSFEEWKRIGSPSAPTVAQYTRLLKAGQLAEIEPKRDVAVKNGTVDLQFNLPRQAVSLLVVERN